MLVQHVAVERLDHHAEHDRVGDLHHRRLQVQREQHALLLGIGDLRLHEGGQRALTHHRRIDQLTGLHRGLFLQHRHRAVLADQLDLDVAGLRDQRRALAAVEVAGIHVRHVRLGLGAPGAHAVRVLACVVLHRGRRAAIGIALAQHRVDRAALDLVVARLGFLLFLILRLVHVVRQRITLLLQFLDRGLELRHRGADVGQLDDVGFRRGRQLAQFGQVVGDALALAQVFGELRNQAAGQRNVAGLHGDASGASERGDDRQQRLRRQVRGFIGERVQDLGRIRHDATDDLWQGE